MDAFLNIVARDVYAKFGENLQQICIVFPNRRSVLYFNKYLSQLVDKPIWAPQCLTISEYIQQYSNLRKADDLLLLFDLYKTYCTVRNSSEPFDTFYFWGELMLSDFDDIDKYMVDPQALFKNLSSLKNINEQFSYLSDQQIEAIRQFWGNFEVSNESMHRKEFSDLWSSLYQIYTTFREKLFSQGIAYEGMIYRKVAESLSEPNTFDKAFRKIAFVGFNALNKCEHSLFKQMANSGKGLFYWDFDLEYSQLDTNTYHEAGFFVRQNLIDFPSALDKSLFSNLQAERNIELIAVPSQVGQAKIAGQLVSGYVSNVENAENTAILLTDENLLMPVLHSIPDSISDVNITMGFPVKNAPVVALIEAIGRLYVFTKTNPHKHNLLYFKLVLNVLKHPYILSLNYKGISDFERTIIQRNSIYIKPSAIPDLGVLNIIFQQPASGVEFTNNLSVIIKLLGQQIYNLKKKEVEQPEGIETETLFVVYSEINRFSDLISQSGNSIEVPLCFRLIMKVLNGLKVPFEGEPLKGLQVMGFLESRALDFENVVILGVNEGNLPKTNTPVSFIPYNLRHGFGLPTLEFRDAMYAYYFYRIIQRAKNVHLVYNTRADKMGSSEISRYATQLKYSGKYTVKQYTQTFTIVPSKLPVIAFNKTEEVWQILEKYITSGKYFLSPSALSSYIDCSLRFYYRYIAGLKEFETPSENIDAPMLGNILHSSMHELYKPLINKELSKSDLLEIHKNEPLIDSIILKAMNNEYFKSTNENNEEELQGRNFIIFKILKKYVKQIVKTDSELSPITLLALEHNIVQTLKCEVDGNEYNVNIGGNIDRIDRVADGVRIIDYKTGKVDTSFMSFDEVFEPTDGSKSKKEIFQAILYSILYKTSVENSEIVYPGIYGLREIFSDSFDPQISVNKAPISNVNSVSGEFIVGLSKILEEIFNKNIPFSQTTDLKKCNYCTYNSICHRC
jgi:hypothetical protein